jgi:peptide/nickel transport system substrate-binding protein
MSRRTPFKLLALLMAFGLFAAACGDADDEAGPGETGTGDDTTTEGPATGDDGTEVVEVEGEVQRGGTLIVGLEAETTGVRPWEDTCGSPCMNIMVGIYDKLLEKEEDGDIAGWLAEGIESNDDLSEWTLTLREGVVFHDGTPLTAENLVAMFELQQTGAAASGIVAATGLQAVEAVDDLTVLYRLAGPNAGFPDALTQPQLGMVFQAEAAAGDPDTYINNPIGTGPFQMVSWDRDNEMVLDRNPDYWFIAEDGEPLPYLDQLIFRPIPDEGTRLDSLLAGTVNVMQALRQSTIRDARAAGDQIFRYEFQGSNTGSTIFNTAKPPVDDVRVRRGLALSIDQDVLIDILGGSGISERATQYFGPASAWYSQEAADGWVHNDREGAIAALQEYVDDPERSDGLAPGSAVQIEYQCPPDPSLIAIAQGYKEFYEATGLVEVSLVQFEQAAHIQRVVGDEYMAACWRLGSDNDPTAWLNTLFADPASSPQNFTNYYSDELWALLTQAKETADFDERVSIYNDVMLYINSQYPHTYTGYTATMVASQPNVRGLGQGFWSLPNGTQGIGFQEAQARYTHVWLAPES